ncbi:hypothetical protein IDJ77_24370 [Mucilaginibacter sp. ZT4R22]|uniref:Uncharacterized protein n=1 Tax=Mucilaginibacter pankratovii TaxID=2772110 RepID=A0ABR7WXF1_9SPHI|nr:hypothetical protein [Mucilaginibacter pankratovii]MBD1366968.1 hypothetical protein [Mucilaginibacter pankratovii]
MELVLKNVQKKHLPLIIELARALKIELSESGEDDKYYLTAMEEGRKSILLNDMEKLDFITSLK